MSKTLLTLNLNPHHVDDQNLFSMIAACPASEQNKYIREQALLGMVLLEREFRKFQDDLDEMQQVFVCITNKHLAHSSTEGIRAYIRARSLISKANTPGDSTLAVTAARAKVSEHVEPSSVKSTVATAKVHAPAPFPESVSPDVKALDPSAQAEAAPVDSMSEVVAMREKQPDSTPSNEVTSNADTHAASEKPASKAFDWANSKLAAIAGR